MSHLSGTGLIEALAFSGDLKAWRTQKRRQSGGADRGDAPGPDGVAHDDAPGAVDDGGSETCILQTLHKAARLIGTPLGALRARLAGHTPVHDRCANMIALGLMNRSSLSHSGVWHCDVRDGSKRRRRRNGKRAEHGQQPKKRNPAMARVQPHEVSLAQANGKNN